MPWIVPLPRIVFRNRTMEERKRGKGRSSEAQKTEKNQLIISVLFFTFVGVMTGVLSLKPGRLNR